MERIAHFIEQHLFACSIKSFTGHECPGCGMQRAFVALLRGDLLSSFQYNPSLLPFLFTLLYTLLHLGFGFRQGARNIVWLFCFTMAVMVVNFVIKLVFIH